MSYIRSIAYTDSDVQVFANNVQIALVRRTALIGFAIYCAIVGLGGIAYSRF